MTIEDVFSDVRREREAQDKIFGDLDKDDTSPDRMLVVLGEEFGEACQAALQNGIGAKSTDKQDLRYELVQIAAVAVKMIQMGDAKGWFTRS